MTPMSLWHRGHATVNLDSIVVVMDAALRNRLTFGPIMLAVLLGILYLDWAIERWTADWAPHALNTIGGLKGTGVLVLMMLIVPPAITELTRLFAATHVTPFRTISTVGSLLLLGHGFATQFPDFKPIATSTLAFIIVGVMIFAALRRAAMKQVDESVVAMAGTLLATMYLGGLCWFLLALRVKTGVLTEFQGTTYHVVMILLCVKFTDIGAFFGGKALGRNKLIPWLSPGKTIEGLACGLIAAAAIGAAAAPFIVNLSWGKGAIFGAVIGFVGQCGDLLESLMKRDAEIKDSGSLIPGFGGILDVLDSPLLAAPVAYLLFSLL